MRKIWLFLVFTACSHPSDAPAPAAAPKPAPAETKTLEPMTDVSSLAKRMSYEAAHRPRLEPTAERVLDAMDAAGLRVAARKQYLAVAMKASYCAGGTTPDGVAISVCEYPDADAATAAKTFADTRYAAIGAAHASRGAAVLTAVGPAPATERALRAFQTL